MGFELPLEGFGIVRNGSLTPLAVPTADNDVSFLLCIKFPLPASAPPCQIKVELYALHATCYKKKYTRPFSSKNVSECRKIARRRFNVQVCVAVMFSVAFFPLPPPVLSLFIFQKNDESLNSVKPYKKKHNTVKPQTTTLRSGAHTVYRILV